MGGVESGICKLCNNDALTEDEAKALAEDEEEFETDESGLPLPSTQLNKKECMFWIENNLAKNVVVYEAKKKNNNNDEYDDIDAYWLMTSESRNNARRKVLSTIDQLGYGIKVTKRDDNRLEVDLAGDPTTPNDFTNLVTDNDGIPHVITKINDRECYIKKMYVKTESRWFTLGIPTVSYIDLTGTDIENQEIRTERHLPS